MDSAKSTAVHREDCAVHAPDRTREQSTSSNALLTIAVLVFSLAQTALSSTQSSESLDQLLQAFPYFYVYIENSGSALANPAAYVAALARSLDDSLRPSGAQATNGIENLDDAGGAAAVAGGIDDAQRAAAVPKKLASRAVKAVQLVRAVPYYGYHYAGPGADPSISSPSTAFAESTSGHAAAGSGTRHPPPRAHRLQGSSKGEGHERSAKYPERGPGHLFARIVLYSPTMLKRATEVVQSGTLGNGFPPFQPYEAHVPFLLQAFIDYNLAGMALLAVKDVRFRLPLPAHGPRKPLQAHSLRSRVLGSRLPRVAGGQGGAVGRDNDTAEKQTPPEHRAAVHLSYEEGGERFVEGGPTLTPSGQTQTHSVFTRLWLASTTPQHMTHGVLPLLSIDELAAAVGQRDPPLHPAVSSAAGGDGAETDKVRHLVGGQGTAALLAQDNLQQLFGKDGADQVHRPPHVSAAVEEKERGRQAQGQGPSRTGAAGFRRGRGEEGAGPQMKARPPPPDHAPHPPSSSDLPNLQPATLPPPSWLALGGYGVHRPEDAHGIGRAGVLTRESTVQLEADVWVEDILNPIEREVLRARATARLQKGSTRAGGSAPSDSSGTHVHVLASSDTTSEDDDLPFGSVFSLAYLWEEEQARALRHGGLPPKKSTAGLSEIQVDIEGMRRLDPQALLHAKKAAAGGLPDLDVEMEEQLARLAAADGEHSRATQGTDVWQTEQAKLAAAIAAFPPAHAVSYGPEPVTLVPLGSRYSRPPVTAPAPPPAPPRPRPPPPARPSPAAALQVQGDILSSAGSDSVALAWLANAEGYSSVSSSTGMGRLAGSVPAEPDAQPISQQPQASPVSTAGESALDWLAGQPAGPSQSPPPAVLMDIDLIPTQEDVGDGDGAPLPPMAQAGRAGLQDITQHPPAQHESVQHPAQDDHASIHDSRRSSTSSVSSEEESATARQQQEGRSGGRRVSFGPRLGTPARGAAPAPVSTAFPSPFSIVRVARQAGALHSAASPGGAGQGAHHLAASTPAGKGQQHSSRRGAKEWEDIIASQVQERHYDEDDIQDEEGEEDVVDSTGAGSLQQPKRGRYSQPVESIIEDEVEAFTELSQHAGAVVEGESGGAGQRPGEAGGADKHGKRRTVTISSECPQIIPTDMMNTAEQVQHNHMGADGGELPELKAAEAGGSASRLWASAVDSIRRSGSGRRAVAWHALQLCIGPHGQGEESVSLYQDARVIALAAEAAGRRCSTPPPPCAPLLQRRMHELEAADGAGPSQREAHVEGDEDEAAMDGQDNSRQGRADAVAAADAIQLTFSQDMPGAHHDPDEERRHTGGVVQQAAVERVQSALGDTSRGAWYRSSWTPPSSSAVHASFRLYGLPESMDPTPHYTRQEDVPDKAKKFAGMLFRLPGSSMSYLLTFDPSAAIKRYYQRAAMEAALASARPVSGTGGAGGVGAQQEMHSAAIAGVLLDMGGGQASGAGPGQPSSFSITRAGAEAGGGGMSHAGAAGEGVEGASPLANATEEDMEEEEEEEEEGGSLHTAKALLTRGAGSDRRTQVQPMVHRPPPSAVLSALHTAAYSPTAQSPHPPRPRLLDYAEAARGRAAHPLAHGHRLPHAFLPELLPGLPTRAPAHGTGSGGGGEGSRQGGTVLLRRYVAGQPDFSALSGFERGACLQRGHIVVTSSQTVTRTLCSRLWLQWSPPFPSRSQVAKWTLRHPAVDMAVKEQELLYGEDTGGAGGTLHEAPHAAVVAPAMPVFVSNTGMLVARDGAGGTMGNGDGSEVGGGVSLSMSVENVSSAQAGGNGTAHTASSSAAAPTVRSETTPGAPTPSTVRAVAQGKAEQGMHSLLSAAAGHQKQTAAGKGQVVGYKPGTVSGPRTAVLPPSDVNQHVCQLSVELACVSRGTLLPDPKHDAITAICYSVLDDDILEAARAECTSSGTPFTVASCFVVGCILVDPSAPPLSTFGRAGGAEKACRGFDDGADQRLSAGLGTGKRVLTLSVPDETSMMWALVALVRAWDADILTGWEVQQSSWGYLFDRAALFGIELAAHLSRTPGAGVDRRHEADDWGASHGSGLWITGRTMLNGWRILKGEVKLGIYTQDNAAWAVLRYRMPHFPPSVLTAWWQGGSPLLRWRVLEYWCTRACLTLAMYDHLDVIGRTSETARLFGIDFYSVLSRGSQYRVEAVMIRVSKPLGYLVPSASRKQVATQAAMEVQPLILEPQSRFYTGPVIVLDFQSLYPSIIIAYNMCYSTCLGRLARPGMGKGAHGYGQGVGAGKATSATDKSAYLYPRLGFMEYSLPDGSAADFHGGPGSASAVRSADRLAPPTTKTGVGTKGQSEVDAHRPHRPEGLFVASNGAMFAPWTVRQGILPRMLNEILDTRVMIKEAAKKSWAKGDPVLQRVLHARQFALKMIANVTYGYTSAGYSGRMPCAEIADAIVSTARDTLDRAIRLVEGHPTWRARVVYGDTDSMFVHVPGRMWREAWEVGEQIAAAVTARNPRPIQLKLDKVYSRSVLVAKKRYAGWMYDSPKLSDSEGVLDVKGLEMVRRDSCGIAQDSMEAVLRQLFTADTDMSALNDYCTRQWTKMHAGRLPLAPYIFAKEVYMGSYSNRGPPPPHAIVASKAMLADPRAEPRQGERVRYVVVYGPRGVPLVDLVLAPHQVLAHPGLYRLHVSYYIEKHFVPALGRVCSLFGVDLAEWYGDMKRPAPRRYRLPGGPSTGGIVAQSFAPPLAPVPSRGARGAGGLDTQGLHIHKLRQAFQGPVHSVVKLSDARGAGDASIVDLVDMSQLAAPPPAPPAPPPPPPPPPPASTGGVSAVTGQSGGPASTTGASGSGAAGSKPGQTAPAPTMTWPYAGYKRRKGVVGPGTGTRTLDAYYATADCEVCGEPTPALLCDVCAADPQKSAYILWQRKRTLESTAEQLTALCRSCTGIGDGHSPLGASACDSLDCPVYYQRVKVRDESVHYASVLGELGLD